ncbi:MAG: hypothetical protein PHI28_03230 [Mangrovibacterium sp.]|nr:hypothetical protein [Mangrovibacterium sp.]
MKNAMEKRKLITGTETLVSVTLFILVGFGLYLGRAYGQERFDGYVEEDGFVENLTALFLFLCSVVSLFRFFEYRKMKKPLWVFTSLTLAVLFFFAAGEEISWGQRILGIESSDFFLEHNKQAETNLHNMVVKGKNLNKLLFAAPIFVILTFYFVFLRALVVRVPFIQKLVYRFRVPLPRIQHVIVIAVVTVMVLLIGLKKEAELHELSFAFIFFLIFLNPVYVNENPDGNP